MKSYRDKADEMYTEWLKMILSACGKVAEGNCKTLCPVDTGRLRNSITYEVGEDGKTVRIGSNVEYASEVEFDDRRKHIVGQAHYLRDGITNSINTCNNLIESMGIESTIKVD